MRHRVSSSADFIFLLEDPIVQELYYHIIPILRNLRVVGYDVLNKRFLSLLGCWPIARATVGYRILFRAKNIRRKNVNACLIRH